MKSPISGAMKELSSPFHSAERISGRADVTAPEPAPGIRLWFTTISQPCKHIENSTLHRSQSALPASL